MRADLLAGKLSDKQNLYVIAKNRKRDQYRKEQNPIRFKKQIEPKEPYSRDAPIEIRVDVGSAIERLKHAELVRRHLEGWTTRELSDAFGYSQSQVCKIVQRAKDSLRKDLSDYGNDRLTGTRARQDAPSY